MARSIRRDGDGGFGAGSAGIGIVLDDWDDAAVIPAPTDAAAATGRDER